MNVIVVEEVAGEYTASGTTLREEGRATQLVPSADGKEIIEREVPDILSVGCRQAMGNERDFSGERREVDEGADCALIAIVEGDGPEARIARMIPGREIELADAA